MGGRKWYGREWARGVIKAFLARESVNYYDDFHLSPLKVRRDGWEEMVWEGMGQGSHQSISG